MRRPLRRAAPAAAVFAAVLAAALAGGGAAAGTRAPAVGSGPPAVAAKAYVVLGGPSSAVLASRAAAQPRPIASITKLMTVLVALSHVGLGEIVTVTPEAARVGESTIYLRAGEKMSVRDLAIAALVPSANDAATALATYAGGGSVSRFVGMMNDEARTLGMRDTHFSNPHGLDQAGHLSSARDVATLLRAALRNPFIREWSTQERATISGGRVVVSTDDLLDRLPLIGAKTGHTNGAGWSQVAAVADGGVRVVASLLGSPSEAQRNDDLESLLRWGLAQYRAVRAVDASRAYAVAATGYGRPSVRAVALRTIVRRVRVGTSLVERVTAVSAVALPVAAGQRLGEVRVYDGARLVARAPLVADRAVAAPGTLDKVGWYARRTVHHLRGMVP